MIATIGLPGLSRFTYRHFNLRGRALSAAIEAWRADWLAKAGESQETLSAVRSGIVLSDAAARRERWRSGQRVYDI